VLAACLAVAAPTQAQPFVYVANNEPSSSVSQYDAIGGGLSPLTPATVVDPGNPFQVAVSPDGKSVYVTNNGGAPADHVSQYDIGPTGALTPKTPATVLTGQDPTGIAVTPDGKSAYVTNFGDGTVSEYDVGPGGVLTPKTPATLAVPGGATRVTVSPDGNSAYVTNVSNTVSQYDVGPTGALTPKTPATVATGAGGESSGRIAFNPNGKSAYVANGRPFFAGTVLQYDVGPTGALTPKTPATVPAGSEPNEIAVTPDGKNVYVTDIQDDTVSQYDVGPTGALTPKTPATVQAGNGPYDIAVSPDGLSAYVTDFDDSTVFQFNVGAGGRLTAKTPATVAAGLEPAGIAVTPLPRVHATATTVSCSPSVFAPGDATVCKATVTDTASAGQTTPTGTVSFTNSGAGRFFGSPCTLSGSGASASCAVFFTSFPRGGRIIAAAYGGDATHSASSGFTGVTVAVPASTEGCVVFGHGRITAANGDKASFRGLVAATPPRGVEFYRDNGPANPFRVASTSVGALTCTDDATTASVFGTAKVNGAGSVEYRIDVQLTAWERGKDTYRIRLSNGYDSGAQPIRHGDVDIHIRTSEHHHHDANANRYKPGVGQDGG
jgi:DNA-binding beta-propeller fold protein YncE